MITPDDIGKLVRVGDCPVGSVLTYGVVRWSITGFRRFDAAITFSADYQGSASKEACATLIALPAAAPAVDPLRVIGGAPWAAPPTTSHPCPERGSCISETATLRAALDEARRVANDERHEARRILALREDAIAASKARHEEAIAEAETAQTAAEVEMHEARSRDARKIAALADQLEAADARIAEADALLATTVWAWRDAWLVRSTSPHEPCPLCWGPMFHANKVCAACAPQRDAAEQPAAAAPPPDTDRQRIDAAIHRCANVAQEEAERREGDAARADARNDWTGKQWHSNAGAAARRIEAGIRGLVGT